MTHQSPLATFRLSHVASLAQAEVQHAGAVTLDTPALDVMTDLTRVRAATTAPGATLHQAEQTMIYQGVRLLFVVDDLPSVEGLITETDLRSDRAMRIVHQRHLHYDELRVADVMTPLHQLDSIDYGRMRSATVANLVATLKVHGRHHLLVVEPATGDTPARIRGVVSQTQLERQLGHRIDLSEIAEGFAEIGQALA